MPANPKQIIKNTLLLYLRMFITMGVSLYTSRVVLEIVGVEDFGIYNIVGGIVMFFSFLNSSMINATQRFLSFEIGRKNYIQLKNTFSMSVTTHISISLIVIILAETIGLWFLNNKLNIPESRMYAANFVYQFSIITFCLQIIKVPFNATIIAYERMSFYAYTSIIEVILKLLLIFSLYLFQFDKLILYSILMMVSTLLMFLVYVYYCNKKFSISKYSFFWDKKLYINLLTFSGWSLLGSSAGVLSIQGVNILLNIFWGVVVNASMGIANQINSAIITFVHNFQTAFKPQIVKTYAENDLEGHRKLVCQASKMSFFLMFILSLPILFNTQLILDLWLKNVPKYSDIFAQLIIIAALIDTIAGPLWVSVHATGNIKKYQIIISSIILLNIIVSFIILRLGYSPQSVLIVRIAVNSMVLLFRVIYIKYAIRLSTIIFIKSVLIPIVLVTSVSVILSHFLINNFNLVDKLFLSSFLVFFIVLTTVYLIGMVKQEKEFINRLIINTILKLKSS